MRLKKLLIGVFIITAVVCGGAEFCSFPVNSSHEPKAVFLISSHREEESVSLESSPSSKREVDTELRYNFTVKISHRFSSFPPRASPLA